MTKQQQKQPLSGWGRYPVSHACVIRPERCRDLALGSASALARGLGRSYGDASLNADGTVILMERLNRFLSFDDKTGLLHAEAGVSLKEILDVFVPRGWFLPVTPGTKFATIGGCIASDVHGKNHHRDGTFGSHITSLELMLADGSKKVCSPQQHPDLFWATVGGMGLTGVITEATLKLIPIETAYMKVRHHVAKNLGEIISFLNDKSKDDKYSVAWIDCLSTGTDFGRSILMSGHHATRQELPAKIKNPLVIPSSSKRSIPFDMPSWLLNPWTVKAFNAIFYAYNKSKIQPFITDYNSYFYPLDGVDNWNRLYGKNGFVQYQFVVPSHGADTSLRRLLEELTQSRRASFLAVIKKFGNEGQGILSFPHEGYTLALDIPMSDPGLLDFLDHLDKLVLKYEGRLYLAKDSRLKPETFRAMYPRYAKWLQVKALCDPAWKFTSDLSRRLQMEGVQ